MSPQQHSTDGEFLPGDFSALQDFLAAYFHEDFNDEYGSAAAAAKAFCGDADADQIRETGAEWQKLRRQFAGRPLSELQGALRALGAAWQPQSEHELHEVDKAFL